MNEENLEGNIPYLISRINDKDFRVRDRVKSRLVELGEPVIQPLLASVKNNTWSLNIIGILTGIGEVTVPYLIAALKDQEDNVRVSAAITLGNIGSRNAVDDLIVALEDRYWRVRWCATNALRNIGDPKAERAVLSLLKDDISIVRSGAATALGVIGSSASVIPLIECLSDSDSNVRFWSVHSLGRLKDHRALPELFKVQNEDKGVNDKLEKVSVAATEAINLI